MLVMMMENQTTASSIGVDDNCNIQKRHCTALLQHAEPSEGLKFWGVLGQIVIQVF